MVHLVRHPKPHNGSTSSYTPDQSYLTQPHDDYATASETSSDEGEEPDYNVLALQGLNPRQVDEHFFMKYRAAKRDVRRHFKKPTRRVRRFIRHKGKGEGQSKGKSRFAFIADCLRKSTTRFSSEEKENQKERIAPRVKAKEGEAIPLEGMDK